MVQTSWFYRSPREGHRGCLFPFPIFPWGTWIDQSEVVLAHRLLGSAVGTVAAACDLQVSTGKDRTGWGSDLSSC